MQCSPSQHSPATTLIDSCVNLNTTRKSAFLPTESSTQCSFDKYSLDMYLFICIFPDYVDNLLTMLIILIVGLCERGNASVDVCLNGPRTLILPKVSPCKYCGAYRFYRESNSICCSKGEICLAESSLPPYLVDLITSVDVKSKEFQNMIRTYNNHFAFTSIACPVMKNINIEIKVFTQSEYRRAGPLLSK
ncbi:hypothetical protein LIER_23633 [Lithospermum erythrorhizon]|uniref:Uncharacterized protein n=1 Tax=Lithospermum erythrorhizon TaxID=34254 RepID=A0AAV3R0K4_LITER